MYTVNYKLLNKKQPFVNCAGYISCTFKGFHPLEIQTKPPTPEKVKIQQAGSLLSCSVTVWLMEVTGPSM